MKRRSFATISGMLLLGSTTQLQKSSLAITINAPDTFQTDLGEVETLLIGFDNIQIKPQRIDDSEDITMKIESTVNEEDIGIIAEKNIKFTEGEEINLDSFYVDILDNPNADSSLFDTGKFFTFPVDLRFIFEHPDVTERKKVSFTVSFVGGELESSNGFSVTQTSDIRFVEVESAEGSGGLELAVWNKNRLQQNGQISAAPSFNNFASGKKGKGIFDLEGRKFNVNMSDNAGESPLSKPTSSVTSGSGDANMALWNKSRQNQWQRQGSSPAFNNFASGYKGKGIMDLAGRDFAVNPSVEDGESELNEPDLSVINS